MSTTENLQDAFAGESQANRKYLAFAKKAEADGYPQIAKLFRAAAEAETVHAHAHLRVMGGIKDTPANLQTAIDGEGSRPCFHRLTLVDTCVLVREQRGVNVHAREPGLELHRSP